eukprot:GFYU01000062.1.p2 GENE.GFYU01000062.1~~GFYU01000062.1.p2  ORF type:complete len:375 (+),score=118.22 GFYU01000062.1:219-1343(+)
MVASIINNQIIIDESALDLEETLTLNLLFDETPPKSGDLSKDDFVKRMRTLATFTDGESFDRYWEMNPRLPLFCNYRCFKAGVSPLWEDKVNVQGGKWVIVCPKSETASLFQKIVGGLLRCEFEYDWDICGVVMAVRTKCDIISLWNKSSQRAAPHVVERIGADLARVTGVTDMKYLHHDWSLNKLDTKSKKRSNAAAAAAAKAQDVRSTQSVGNRDNHSPTTNTNDRFKNFQRNNRRQHYGAGGRSETGGQWPRGQSSTESSPTSSRSTSPFSSANTTPYSSPHCSDDEDCDKLSEAVARRYNNSRRRNNNNNNNNKHRTISSIWSHQCFKLSLPQSLHLSPDTLPLQTWTTTVFVMATMRMWRAIQMDLDTA